jgi:hypothetical protein
MKKKKIEKNNIMMRWRRMMNPNFLGAI